MLGFGSITEEMPDYVYEMYKRYMDEISDAKLETGVDEFSDKDIELKFLEPSEEECLWMFGDGDGFDDEYEVGTEKYKHLCLVQEARERVRKSDFEDDPLAGKGSLMGREYHHWEDISETTCDDKSCKSKECRFDRIYNFLYVHEEVMMENKNGYDQLLKGAWDTAFIIEFRKKGNAKLINYLKASRCNIVTLLEEDKDESPYYYCYVRFTDNNGFDIKPE